MELSAKDQVKERLNIVDVVGAYVKLTKSGKNYRGLSPFKKEKTPSFYVSPDKGMYYDFSSGKGGDIFTFIEEVEGVDFKGALKMLAERAGVTVTHESTGSKDARDRLFEMLEEACRFYETKLSEHSDAQRYLTERGLTGATMRHFRLGFAPEGWTVLKDFLTAKGFSERDLESAGLVKHGERGRYYDRFRSRIVFPIFDTAGRVIAFSGRIFGAAAEDKENAKYLNSPETALFDKGRVLYGYDRAKQGMRTSDSAIIVEGQMDLVLSHQAGYVNTVAVSGTGLTAEHLALIGRLTKRAVLAFDADSAGVASVARAAALALPQGFDLKAVRVPVGKDPADCIREDVSLWKEAVKRAVHVVDFFMTEVEHALGPDVDSRKRVLAVRDRVLPLIALIESAVDRAHFEHRVADVLAVPDASVHDEVERMRRAAERGTTYTPTVVSAPREERPSRKELVERGIASILFAQASASTRVLEESYVRERTQELGLSLEGVVARYEQEREVLAFEAEVHYGDNPHAAFDELLVTLACVRMREEREALGNTIKEFERRGEHVEARSALERYAALAKKLEQLEKATR